MKDTVITAKNKRRELFTFLVCLAAAVIVNTSCIIYFDTQWIELFTQIGYTFCIAAILYVLSWVVRLIWRLFHRKFNFFG